MLQRVWHLLFNFQHLVIVSQFCFSYCSYNSQNIIKERFIVLKIVLTDKFAKPTRCETDWLEIARDFQEISNLTNVVSALDGKHIQIEAPANSGMLFRNYKVFFSIILLAICDANYCFTLGDIGQFCSNNDSGVLANSNVGKQFEKNRMKLSAGRHFHVVHIARSCTTQLVMRYSHLKVG